MNLVDLSILVIAVIAAASGARLGGVNRTVSWIVLAAFVAGALALASAALHLAAQASTAIQLTVVVCALVGGLLGGHVAGTLLGSRTSRLVRPGRGRAADRVAGGLVGLLTTLAVAWAVLPSLATVRGIEPEVRGSAIGSALDRVAAPPADALGSLKRILVPRRLPSLYTSLRAVSNTAPPFSGPGGAARLERLEASTVEVEGMACGRLQQGSGFAVSADRIVTNAHVVAGEQDTVVTTPDGRRLHAVVTRFDADRDIAVLRVHGLGETPLALSRIGIGGQGVVLGHPGGQAELAVINAAVEDEVAAQGRDLYGRHDTSRDVLVLSSRVLPGDSGAPFVTGEGKVAGIVFAISPGHVGIAYALAPSELGSALHGGEEAVTTGACVSQ